jgi:pimeloyl-ACP methyl ester carboxylesterase
LRFDAHLAAVNACRSSTIPKAAPTTGTGPQLSRAPLLSSCTASASTPAPIDRAWDRFGAELPKLAVPTLAVHGVNDPIAPIDPVRAYAEQIEPLQLQEFPGAHHDILNETVHREVAEAIVDFIESQGLGSA